MGWLGFVGLTFATAVLGQNALIRLGLLGNAFNAFLTVGGSLGVALVVLMFLSYPVNTAVSGTIVYALLCELFIFAFTFVHSSVSANLLVRLDRRPMDRAEIDGLYDDRGMIQQRIDGLVRTGLLQEREGSLRATAKGVVLARAFDIFRRLFGHT